MKTFVFGTRGFPGVQGGVEKHCEELYPRFSDKSEITVFRRKSYIANKEMGDIHFIDLPSTQIKGFEALFHSFLCSLYSIAKRPDVVHIHNIGPALFAPLLKLFGLKVVVTYHSPNYNHKKWSKMARMLLKASEYITFKFADCLIYVNKGQMGLAPQYVQDKSIYLPNGVSPFPAYSESEKEQLLNQYGLKANNYIFAVGRLTQEKGFDLLIKAFDAIDNKNNYKLVIAGDNPSDPKYCNYLKTLVDNSNIVFTGSLQGAPLGILYDNCALFVLSSRNEGFPLVLLEAMNSNKPVLATDIVRNLGLPLQATDFFESESEESLLKALNFKVNHDLKKSADINYDLSQFNWQNIASSTEDILCSTSLKK